MTFGAGRCCCSGPGSRELLLTGTPGDESAYPSELFVLQGQHTRAFCEQLHLHGREGVGRREVALGAPAVDRTREVSVASQLRQCSIRLPSPKLGVRGRQG